MTSDADRVIRLYQQHALEFDRERGRSLFEKPWLDRFLARLSGPSVLDIGCGSGEPIGRYLIEQGCRVTGIDASIPLIAMCRDRFPDHEWIVADMREIDLGRRFDGILAWHSSFHLDHDNQRRMFPVFGRHAGSGAALMFTSGLAHGDAVSTYHGEPLYHASLDAEEYRSLLDRQGFRVVDHAIDDHECGYATVWLSQLG
jgi:SAM-dependent methyltransferase